MNKKSAAFIVSIMLLVFIGAAFYGETEKDYILAANKANFSTEDMPIRPKQLSALSGKDVRREIARAKNSFNAKKYSEAISILENIKRQGVSEMEVDQLLAMAYVNYSYIQMKEGKITSEEFIEMNKKAYDLDPNRPEPSYNLAVTFGKKGDIEEGIKWLEKSYSIMSQDKYKTILKSFTDDPDLNILRRYPEFNSRFPKLALKAPEEKVIPRGEKPKEEEKPLSTSWRVGAKRFNLIGVDNESGTRFSMVDKSGGMAGSDPCKGGWGIIEVIGEVPSNVSLEDDSLAQSLTERGKDIALKVCPRFSIEGGKRLNLWLFKEEYKEKADVVVSAEWSKDYPRQPMTKKYQNKAYENARYAGKLAAGTIRPLEQGGFIHLLGDDPQTRTKFWHVSGSREEKCIKGRVSIIIEIQDKGIILNDAIANSLVIEGVKLAVDDCNEKRGADFSVWVAPVGFKYTGWSPEPVLVYAYGHTELGEPKIVTWNNKFLIAEQERLKKEEARMREQEERQKARTRFNEFVQKYGVQDWPRGKALSANPFLYEGKSIGIRCTFIQMQTATQGLFMIGGGLLDIFIASNIPKGIFKMKSEVILAGRVLGTVETKLPVAGSVMVPHMKFLGVHFCQESACRDIIP